ncbi:MAG: peptidyl-prolyl cis-trans isomerase [Pontixanthobacter sp.]
MNLKRWAREPLFHFLFAGAVLFAFFAWRGEPADPTSRIITISQEDRAQLALQWEATMQRPPTDAELDSLTESWLREEILYREAIRLGLDRDDAVVRKRLANKMEFLSTSIAETVQPTDAELEKWLADRPQRFAEDTDYSFDQLYFAEKADAQAALKRVQGKADWQALGESISLPLQVDDMLGASVASRFGEEFLEQLQGLDQNAKSPSTWVGPVLSGFGWHLVRLRKRDPGKVPKLADIRQRVENDWRNATLEKRREESYQLLRDSYTISGDK